MRMTPRVTLRALATASLLWSVFFASRTAATAAAAAPAWWRASHLRVDVESKSELEQPSGELLAQLAVLLMPDEPIEELFRRFPTPEGSTWGHEAGRRLWMALAYMRGRVVWVREVPKDCQNSGKVKVNSIWRHSRS
ncbi:unnamed protein product [Durusdinium trenchii]|uniref:Uncharacterized protein n=1 Tax=Durusdinium trenchii TaxID=1381693 RepID=A0ABP0PNF6_9DINO